MHALIYFYLIYLLYYFFILFFQIRLVSRLLKIPPKYFSHIKIISEGKTRWNGAAELVTVAATGMRAWSRQLKEQANTRPPNLHWLLSPQAQPHCMEMPLLLLLLPLHTLLTLSKVGKEGALSKGLKHDSNAQVNVMYSSLDLALPNHTITLIEMKKGVFSDFSLKY